MLLSTHMDADTIKLATESLHAGLFEMEICKWER